MISAVAPGSRGPGEPIFVPSGQAEGGGGTGAARWRRWTMAGVAVLALQMGTAAAAGSRAPEVCDRPHLSEASRTHCASRPPALRFPKLCRRHKLSDETQRWCDRTRFAGEPHYVILRLTRGGVITSMHLIRTEDGAEVVTSHPYGPAFERAARPVREIRIRLGQLERFVARRPEPAASSPSPYNTGLLIGWNPSTGQTPGECYNFTSAQPAANVGSLSFSSENAASSVAAQTRVSATVSGGFGAFSASASFAYSDQWQSSANSGSVYFNISSVYTLNNTVDPNDPLNTQGENAGDQFATLCGTEYMASVPGGMVATLAVAYGSSSQTAKSDIDAAFSASFELDSLKAAVDVAHEKTDSESFFNVSLSHSGGGAQAGALLTTSFGATNSDGDSYVEECSNGDVDACELFVSNMATGAINAGNAFDALAQEVEAGENLNFFALLPSGVAGVDTSALVTETVESQTDVLAPYQDQLEQYLTLLNEIGTLGNRATHLNGLLADGFNSQTLDLVGYLDRLIDDTEGAVSYVTNRATLLEDLGTCLNATASNVTEACAPIIDGGASVASAYDWYDAEHGNADCTSGDNQEACWLLQQNTIALQYAANFDEVGVGALAMDILYVDVLPPFSDPIAAPVSGKAGFVAFADRPWITDIVERGPNVSFLALTNDTDLAEIYTSIEPSQTSAFEWFGFDDHGWHVQSGDVGRHTRWTTAICEPSFDDPCPIGFEWHDPTVTTDDVLQSANGIEDLFAAD